MAVLPMTQNQAQTGICLERNAPVSRSSAGTPAAEPAAGISYATGISLEQFNALVLEYQDAAYTFACYLTGDSDLAEDVTQKAFINAYLNIHQYRGASFRAWLFKIIRNTAYDEFRRPSYRKDTSLDAMEDTNGWASLSADTQDPQNAVEALERSRLVRRAIERVAEPYRSILVMVDIHEMDYQEAAQAAGVPVGTVKSRLARARQHFRQVMESLSQNG